MAHSDLKYRVYVNGHITPESLKYTPRAIESTLARRFRGARVSVQPAQFEDAEARTGLYLPVSIKTDAAPHDVECALHRLLQHYSVDVRQRV